MRDPKSLLITGASGGLGAALAAAYAGPGVHLALIGRNTERLGAVATRCRTAGADVTTASLDVTDDKALALWIDSRDEHRPIDLLIANAGISAGTGGYGENAEQARRVFSVNVDGVLNSVLPLVPRMQARKRGQIALVSSLAAFIGFPGAPAYSASKAAIKVYGEALRGALHADGIEVNVICPGFVDTPMTQANAFPMPLLVSSDKAAAIIKRGLAANRGRIAFPFPMYFLVWLLSGLPPVIVNAVTRHLPEKRSAA